MDTDTKIEPMKLIPVDDVFILQRDNECGKDITLYVSEAAMHVAAVDLLREDLPKFDEESRDLIKRLVEDNQIVQALDLYGLAHPDQEGITCSRAKLMSFPNFTQGRTYAVPAAQLGATLADDGLYVRYQHDGEEEQRSHIPLAGLIDLAQDIRWEG